MGLLLLECHRSTCTSTKAQHVNTFVTSEITLQHQSGTAIALDLFAESWFSSSHIFASSIKTIFKQQQHKNNKTQKIVVNQWHNKWGNHNSRIKKCFQEVSQGGGAQTSKPRVHVCRYFASEWVKEGVSSWWRTESFFMVKFLSFHWLTWPSRADTHQEEQVCEDVQNHLGTTCRGKKWSRIMIAWQKQLDDWALSNSWAC